MKLSIIGGGSSYVPLILQSIFAALPTDDVTVALFDLRAERADEVARALNTDELPRRVKVRSTKVLEDALQDADYILLLYRAGPPAIRIELEGLALEYGLLAQETQGMCGFFSALLNIQALKHIADRILVCAPSASVIVLTNPTGIITSAAQELGLQAIGVCELPFGMVTYLREWVRSQKAGASVRATYLGTNHFGWLSHIAIDGASVRPSDLREYVPYCPPSIPMHVAKSAAALHSSGFPNPYIGFLASNPQAASRGAQVQLLETLTRETINAGRWGQYQRLMARRGGFIAGSMLASLIGGIVRQGYTDAIVCSKSSKLAGRFGCNAAYEFSAEVTDKLNLSESVDDANLSVEAENMIRLVADYELHTVTAALTGSISECTQAIILNPYIAAGDNAHRAFRQFLDSYAGLIFEDSAASL